MQQFHYDWGGRTPHRREDSAVQDFPFMGDIRLTKSMARKSMTQRMRLLSFNTANHFPATNGALRPVSSSAVGWDAPVRSLSAFANMSTSDFKNPYLKIIINKIYNK